jgi:hypothetical protein
VLLLWHQEGDQNRAADERRDVERDHLRCGVFRQDAARIPLLSTVEECSQYRKNLEGKSLLAAASMGGSFVKSLRGCVVFKVYAEDHRISIRQKQLMGASVQA